jgi:hypothetical protein
MGRSPGGRGNDPAAHHGEPNRPSLAIFRQVQLDLVSTTTRAARPPIIRTGGIGRAEVGECSPAQVARGGLTPDLRIGPEKWKGTRRRSGGVSRSHLGERRDEQRDAAKAISDPYPVARPARIHPDPHSSSNASTFGTAGPGPGSNHGRFRPLETHLRPNPARAGRGSDHAPPCAPRADRRCIVEDCRVGLTIFNDLLR